MSYQVHCKVYFVGQGSMNLVFVEEVNTFGRKSIPVAALIDAGSKDGEETYSGISKNLEEVINILKTADQPHILLTHYHDDHYKFITSTILPALYDSYKLAGKKVFIYGPGLFRVEGGYANYVFLPNSIGIKTGNYLKEIIEPIGVFKNTINQVITTATIEGAFTLRIMTGCFGDESDENTYGVTYLAKDIAKNRTFVFTGDITGETFTRLKSQDLTAIKDLIGSSDVYVTVPHHGSLHTLESLGKFSPKSEETAGFVKKKADSPYIYEFINLGYSIVELGIWNIKKPVWFVSSCFWFCHPAHQLINYLGTYSKPGGAFPIDTSLASSWYPDKSYAFYQYPNQIYSTTMINNALLNDKYVLQPLETSITAERLFSDTVHLKDLLDAESLKKSSEYYKKYNWIISGDNGTPLYESVT